MLRLSPRLAAAASLIEGGEKHVDIGTDHAYLPVWLVQSGKCAHVLATDIGVLPLKNAEKTLLRYGAQEAVSLRISNGLQSVRPEEAEEISICGMGGTLIADILAEAPWIKKPGMRLVLQPMTHGEDVRKYLCENGFAIRKEICITEPPRRVYCCIAAAFTGNAVQVSPGFYYFGTLLCAGGAAKAYVRKQYDRIVTRAEAIRYYLEQVNGDDD